MIISKLCTPRTPPPNLGKYRAALDRNDRRVLAAVGTRRGRVLSYEFPIGRDEPVLWAADVVASAVFRALRRDKNDLLAALGDMAVLDFDSV